MCLLVNAGVESMIAPVLLSEIAAADTRGAITSLHQLNVSAFTVCHSCIDDAHVFILDWYY